MAQKQYPHFIPSKRKLCPVCKKPVYAQSDIHPQCAEWQHESSSLRAKALTLKPVTPVVPIVNIETAC